MKIKGWPARLLIAFGFHLLRLWTRTLRFRIEDRAGVVDTPADERVIGALWHNRVLLWPHVAGHFLSNRRAAALISASRDGDLLADFVQRFGVDVVRGSSSRKGASAILQLADVIASGRDVAITPDGPRGPAYEIGAGIVFLAQRVEKRILLTHMEYSSCWRFRSWDRFIVPRPFSTVRVKFGPLHVVHKTASDAEFESERLRLQNAMMDLVEMR